ncbi:hypothetical protein BKA70DRAFT_1256128 [Coprinopsis sp. MPI-PUGE-AT-0042]|nr:hypothetical protein BKA70DRAFT_1256128 [Coprinopsis sp. MPI-PUGE-AT-0042]
MRWSLVVLVTALLQTLLFVTSSGRPLFPSSESADVFIRGKSATSTRDSSLNAGSAAYRGESKYHKWVYYRSPNGDIVRERAKGAQSVDGLHGDHIFELQMVIKHLKANGLQWTAQDVPTHVQKQVKALINSRKNVAPIYPSVNIKKGQSIKSATAGKASKTVDSARDSYILLSYGTSKSVADDLDNIYKKGIPKAKKSGWVTARKYLGQMLDSSRVLKPGVAEPPTSDSSSGSSGYGSGSESGSASSSTPSSPKGKGKKRARSSSVSSTASGSSDSSYHPGPQRGKRKANRNSGRRVRQKK